MSGMVFFGVDSVTNKSMHASINSYNWDALGELLDTALERQHPEIYKIIKSEEAMALGYYYFNELNKSEFETAIEAIRNEISKWSEVSAIQLRAKQVWETICESWILRDKRLRD